MIKKLLVFGLVLILIGCASAPKQTYTPAPGMMDKLVKNMNETWRCIKGKDQLWFFISSAQGHGAWIEGNKVYITESLLRDLNDDAIQFVLAHEIAHNKLGHIEKAQAVSYATTGLLVVADLFVPGIGLLNHAVNPAIVNNFSKLQEYDADEEAAAACECLGIDAVETMRSLRPFTRGGGGFWDQHGSWEDRIENIRN